MADRQLYIEIVVDDKGAVQKLAAVDKSLKTVGGSGSSAGKGLTEFEKSVMKASAAGAFLAETVYDVARGALSMLQRGISSSVTVASKFQNTFIGLTTVARAFGQDVDQTTTAAQALATDGLMTVQEAAAGLKNLLSAGFGLPEAIQLMTGFKDIAAFNRQASLEFGYAVVSATEGIKNQNSILVDNAGLTKNLSVIMKEAGLELSDLSRLSQDAGVKQKFLGGLMKEMAFATGDAAKMADTYSGAVSRKNTNLSLLQKEVGDRLMPVFTMWNNVLNKGIEIARQAPVAFMAVAGALTVLAGLAAGYGVWAIYGATILKVGTAFGTLATSATAAIATVNVALVAATAGVGALALALTGLANWYANSTQKAEIAAYKTELIARASKVAGREVKSYTEAVEVMARWSRDAAAEQQKLADQIHGVSAASRAQLNAIQAEAKVATAIREADKQYYAEIGTLAPQTLERIKKSVDDNVMSTKQWAEILPVTQGTLDRFLKTVKDSEDAAADRAKAAEKQKEKEKELTAAIREQTEETYRQIAAVRAAGDLPNFGLPKILQQENDFGLLGPMVGGFGGKNDPLFGPGGRADLPDWMKRENMGIFDGAQKMLGLKDKLLGGSVASLLGALQGGGNVGASIGGSLGAGIADHIGKGIASKVAAGTIGKALGSVLGSAVPIVGPLLGSIGGKLVGKLFGGLFGGGEKKKVQEALGKTMQEFGGEDKFRALAKEAGIADREIAKLFSSKKVKDYEAQLKKIVGQMEAHNKKVQEAQLLTDAQAQRQQLLNEAVGRYKFSIEELGPAMQKQQLAEQAEQILTDWQLLTEAGVNNVAIIREMSGSINEFVQRAIKTGHEVPEAMRPILQAMIEQGKLTDANGNLITDMEKAGIKFGESLTTMFKGVLEKLDELIARLTEASRPRTGRVDVEINETVNRRVHEERDEREGRTETYHWGGPIRRAHTGLAIDEVPIIAQAGEGIVSRRGMRRLGVAGLHALNQGGAVGGDNREVVDAVREGNQELVAAIAGLRTDQQRADARLEVLLRRQGRR